ncbi:MAG: hypothetical protein M0P69_19950 [Bacteroidales bacterium]|nr:hypothetical protein [Bacteroidales bacterium]
MNLYMIEIDGGEELPIEAESIEMACKIAEKYIEAHYYDANHMTFEVREIEEEQPASEGIKEATAEVMHLLLEKNAKYGNNNLTKYGHTGILVRLSDKLSRLENMAESGAKNVNEYNKLRESIEDVYKDIAGYGILGLKLMREGRL